MKGPACRGRPRAAASSAARWLALAGLVGAALTGLGGCAGSTAGQSSGSGGSSASGGTDAGAADSGGPAGSSGHAGAGGRGSGGRPAGGGGAAGAGLPGGNGGNSTGAAGTTGAGGNGIQGPCFVTVEIVSPTLRPNTIEVGPDVRVRVRGTVSNSKSASPRLTWNIMFAATGALATMPEGGADSNEVSFPATMTGKYQIMAQPVKEPDCTAMPLVITGVRSSPAFKVRVTASGFPVTEKVIQPTISEVPLPLDPGREFRIEPQAWGQQVVMPAYLRINSSQSGLTIEGFTSHGALPARLSLDQTYDLLVVPVDPSYAPDLFSPNPNTWTGSFIVDPGTPVVGLVLGPDGAPLEGARMLLKRGSRPSTIGTSDGNGMLSLRARPGVMTAIVVPPAGSGLPQATVVPNGSDSDLNLTAAMASLSITTRFQAIAQGPLTLIILDPSGASPVSGARVRIASQPDLPAQGDLPARTNIPAAAILTASVPGGPDTQLTASSSVNAEVLSDAGGRASFGLMPAGKYDVLVIPPAGSSSQAITTLPLELQSGGVVPASAATITMATKVALTGTLSSSTADAAGASITAVDTGDDGSGGVASAVADAKGAFTLVVSPKRSYRIIAQPVAGSASIRTVFGVDDVGVGVDGAPTTPVALTLRLQRGRTLNGTVESEGSPIGQAFIQIFCVSSVPSCVDPTISLAETTTRGDGTFGLLIPDTDATP